MDTNILSPFPAPGLDFTQPSFDAEEGDGTVEVCMILTPPPGGVECDVVIALATENGKARKLSIHFC